MFFPGKFHGWRSLSGCKELDTTEPRTAAKSLQSCPTLCDSVDGSPPGSPVPGILQARTLKWVAISLEVRTTQVNLIHMQFSFFKKYMYLLLAVLGLGCCVGFSHCGEWGLLFIAVLRLLIVVASLVVEHGL